MAEENKKKNGKPHRVARKRNRPEKSGNPAVRALSKDTQSQPTREPVHIGSPFWSRVKAGIKGRARWPKKGVTHSDYLEAMDNNNLRVWVSISITFILLVVWILMYFAASQSLGGIRLNNSLLDTDINTGDAFWVKSVSEDGGVLLKNGTHYPAGSIKDTVLVSHYFETPYYIPEERILAAPIDLASFFKETAQVWIWAGITPVWFGLDKLYSRRYLPKKYYEVVYDSYPKWFRFTRWGVVVVMVATCAFWFWPFI